jgi:hypothetical protein
MAANPFLNDATVNTLLETVIGAPVETFQPNANERRRIGVYNICKPILLQTFEYINRRNEAELKNLIQQSLWYFGVKDQESLQLLQGAVNAGLLPPINPPPSPDILHPQWQVWANNYYNYLFTAAPPGHELGIVIQGGEAVNYYTRNKMDGIATHDCDVRILVGNHFTYNTLINAAPVSARRQLHIYKFFIQLVIDLVVQKWLSFLGEVQPNGQMKGRDFLIQHVPEWNAPSQGYLYIRNGAAHPINNPIPYRTMIQTNQYPDISLQNYLQGDVLRKDAIIHAILKLTLHLTLPNGQVHAIDLIDINAPKGYNIINLGHTANIHKYFSSDYANQMGRAYSIHPPYTVPSYQFDIPLGPGIPGQPPDPRQILRRNAVSVRIPSLGYTIWDTLRMLIISAAYSYQGYENKLLRYKQKMLALLGQLMWHNNSQHILDWAQEKKSIDNNINRMVAGGETPEEVLSDDFVRRAKQFASTLSEDDTSIDSSKFNTPEQKAGYLHFLGETLAGFSEFRLPYLPEEIEAMGDRSYDHSRSQSLLQSLLTTPKGGYRKKTRRAVPKRKRKQSKKQRR